MRTNSLSVAVANHLHRISGRVRSPRPLILSSLFGFWPSFWVHSIVLLEGVLGGFLMCMCSFMSLNPSISVPFFSPTERPGSLCFLRTIVILHPLESSTVNSLLVLDWITVEAIVAMSWYFFDFSTLQYRRGNAYPCE